MLGNTPSYYPFDSDTPHHLFITIPNRRFKRNNPHYYRTHERIQKIQIMQPAHRPPAESRIWLEPPLIMHLGVVALH
jgi:hypothetical protein